MVLGERRERDTSVQDGKRSFARAAVSVIERDARPGDSELLYLDRKSGYLVSFAYTPPDFSGNRLFRRKRKNIQESISVLVVDTKNVEGELGSSKGYLKGGVFVLGKTEGHRGRREVDFFKVSRPVAAFPNYNHEVSLGKPDSLNGEGYMAHADVLKGLKAENVIIDKEECRTAAEVAEDKVLAKEFVEWINEMYRGTKIDFEKGSEGIIPNPGSIWWFGPEGEMTVLTFVPRYHHGFGILVKQEQTNGIWIVSEYVVDETVPNMRIYKHISGHLVEREEALQGEGLIVPPFSYGEGKAPAPFQAIKEVKKGRSMAEILVEGDRVQRSEIKEMMNQAREHSAEFDGDLS